MGISLKTLETKCFLPRTLNANNRRTIPWRRIHSCRRGLKEENDPSFVKADLERLSPIRRKWVRLHFIRRSPNPIQVLQGRTISGSVSRLKAGIVVYCYLYYSLVCVVGANKEEQRSYLSGRRRGSQDSFTDSFANQGG